VRLSVDLNLLDNPSVRLGRGDLTLQRRPCQKFAHPLADQALNLFPVLGIDVFDLLAFPQEYNP